MAVLVPHDSRRISDDQKAMLRQLFLMDGITPTQAAEQAGVDTKTARAYFAEWAEELVNGENYVPWVEMHERVKARALEGTTREIIKVQTTISKLEKIYDSLLAYPEDHPAIIAYDRALRDNRILLDSLKSKANAIELAPPARAIIDAEVERQIAERQSLKEAAK